jgi:hypothetical protein
MIFIYLCKYMDFKEFMSNKNRIYLNIHIR